MFSAVQDHPARIILYMGAQPDCQRTLQAAGCAGAKLLELRITPEEQLQTW